MKSLSKEDPLGRGEGEVLKFLAKILMAPSEKKISSKPNQVAKMLAVDLAHVGREGSSAHRSVPFQNRANACVSSLLSVELLNVMNCESYIDTLQTHICHSSL